MKQLTPSALLVASLLALSLTGDGLISTAQAKIHRSCSGKYLVHVFDQHWNYVGKTPAYTFTARGGCGNLVPNRCRRRARDTAMACMQDHYINQLYTVYNNGDLPQKCDVGSIETYSVRQLISKLRQAACSITNHSGTYMIKTHAHVDGKTGCSGAAADKLLKLPTDTHPEFKVIYCP